MELICVSCNKAFEIKGNEIDSFSALLVLSTHLINEHNFEKPRITSGRITVSDNYLVVKDANKKHKAIIIYIR